MWQAIRRKRVGEIPCNDCRASLTSVEKKLKAGESFSDTDEHPAEWNTGRAYPEHRLELLARETATEMHDHG